MRDINRSSRKKKKKQNKKRTFIDWSWFKKLRKKKQNSRSIRSRVLIFLDNQLFIFAVHLLLSIKVLGINNVLQCFLLLFLCDSCLPPTTCLSLSGSILDDLKNFLKIYDSCYNKTHLRNVDYSENDSLNFYTAKEKTNILSCLINILYSCCFDGKKDWLSQFSSVTIHLWFYKSTSVGPLAWLDSIW